MDEEQFKKIYITDKEPTSQVTSHKSKVKKQKDPKKVAAGKVSAEKKKKKKKIIQ